jgi:cystathionine beta-synthase
MQYQENILGIIGNTPLIRINKVIEDIPALVLVKLETVNPGHSIKDRMALKMLLDAEARGDISPGGTIIECTSGNTGMGLAIAGAVRGYKSISPPTTNSQKRK